MNLRRCQYKNQIRRRLLQRLQERIKCTRGKHMHFVDNIYFIPALGRRILNLFDHLADIIHFIIGCRIHLHHVHGIPRSDRLTHLTLATGSLFPGGFTVDCPGKYLCHRRLSGSTGSTEQIGMSNMVGSDLVLQSGYDMILSLYLLEIVRSEFAVQRLIRHA